MHRPLRRIECGKKNRSRLNREPRDHRVSDRNLVNVAPLQFGKKVSRIHDASEDKRLTGCERFGQGLRERRCRRAQTNVLGHKPQSELICQS